MKTIVARNVHRALPEGSYQLRQYGVLQRSRNGDVVVLPIPLTTVYQRPTERVLFHPERDANPFFHFMESLWMLAGRNDVEMVSFYNSGMRRYSDDGVTFNAAYGHRWRKHFGVDQVNQIITNLRGNPECRRQVLSIWDARNDLSNSSKDLPCNTQAYFQVDCDGKLQMMVTNRSNDLIWGAYGANAVHFSFLLEYMATSMDREVGTYYQTSFNTHFYVEPHSDLVDVLSAKATHPPSVAHCPYSRDLVRQDVPLMSIPKGRWDRELQIFMQYGGSVSYTDPFFQTVAVPMLRAYIEFKSPHTDRFNLAYQALGQCASSDWALAGQEWLQRREEKCNRMI